MELLQRLDDSGYPEEYLAARIKGRGARFVRDWDGFAFSPDPAEHLSATEHREDIEEHAGEGAWLFHARELKWLHTQMSDSLKDIFASFFIYIEIETLIICFRYKHSQKEGSGLEKVLRYSLLSNKVKDIVLLSDDLPELLGELGKRGLLPPGAGKDLAGILEDAGLQALEQVLRTGFLETVMEMKLQPELRDFFRYTIDSRNLSALFRCLRWGVKTAPYFVSGGGIGLSRQRKIFYDNSIPELERLVFNLSGLRVKDASPAGIDNALKKGLAKRLKTARRRGGSIDLILNYLWECYMEAHDLSTVLYGKGVDRDLLREELLH